MYHVSQHLYADDTHIYISLVGKKSLDKLCLHVKLKLNPANTDKPWQNIIMLIFKGNQWV